MRHCATKNRRVEVLPRVGLLFIEPPGKTRDALYSAFRQILGGASLAVESSPRLILGLRLGNAMGEERNCTPPRGYAADCRAKRQKDLWEWSFFSRGCSSATGESVRS